MDQEKQQQLHQTPEKQAVAATTTATAKHPGGGSNHQNDFSASSSSSTTAAPPSSSTCTWEERVQLVREHYERKGYRVRSGLQFGCELVLYADDLGRVHSDFCIHVVPQDGFLDWRQMQSLVRSMPALRKTLILANLVVVKPKQDNDEKEKTEEDQNDVNKKKNANINYHVQELALASEHAPFRLRNRTSGAVIPTRVGAQKKRKKAENSEIPS